MTPVSAASTTSGETPLDMATCLKEFSQSLKPSAAVVALRGPRGRGTKDRRRRKRHHDPKVQVGKIRESSETFPHKAKPFEPGVRRRLRKARSEERLEEPDPIGRDR